MKKIVALVLSLVLALSLCATAFAANETVYWLNKKGGQVDKNQAWTGGTLDTVKAHTNAKGGGNIMYYTWTEKVAGWDYTSDAKSEFIACDEWDSWTEAKQTEYNTAPGATWSAVYTADFVTYLIPCDQDEATAAIHGDFSYQTYVFLADSAKAAEYDCTATAQAATKDLPNCTRDQFKYDGYVCDCGYFYIADENGGTALNVDGKIIHATCKDNDTDYVIHASHIFAKGVKNTKTGYDVATCLICKGEFACTNSDAVATKNGYKISTGFEYSVAAAGKVYDANAYANGYDFKWGQTYAGNYAFCWELKPGTTEEIGTKPATDTKTGVDSAKTFDAGIAMYVGMSLLSVAGSAVVIGKKKEF